MRVLRKSSLEEYASWYLRREARKGDPRPVPVDPVYQVKLMWERHRGKMRDWFTPATSWRIVSLDLASDFYNLVFLESKWTLDEELVIPSAPNYRVLRRVAENAIATKYLVRASAQHKAYYEAIAGGTISLVEEKRIAICSAEDVERKSNPIAQYYLLDGAGRALPYVVLLVERKLEYKPVEAFLAEIAQTPSKS